MRLSDVMDDVAARLRSITEFRAVYEWPVGKPGETPAAIVAYPESYNPRATYQRGAAAMTLPVIVVVGKASERTARDELSQFVDGSGASSVIAVLESGTYTAFEALAVSDNIEFDVVTIGETDYIAALFDVDIMGSGR